MAADHRHRVDQAAGPERREEAQRHADRMAKVMAAKTSFSDGQMRSADQLGHRLARAERRAEIAHGGVGDVLGEALGQRIVEAHLLAHALHHRRVDGRAAVLAHARDEAPGQDAEQQEDQRDDGEQGRDDVGEAAAEDEQHRLPDALQGHLLAAAREWRARVSSQRDGLDCAALRSGETDASAVTSPARSRRPRCPPDTGA